MSNCAKCDDKGFTWGKAIFPNGREKNICDCKKISNDPMSKDQIENFRKVLIYSIGPYALIMPESDIVAIRNRFQQGLMDRP